MTTKVGMARLRWRLVRWQRRSLAAVLRGVVLKLDRQYEVDGIRVYARDPRIDIEACLDKLGVCLELLGRFDLQRRHQLQRYVRQIALWNGYTAFDILGGIQLSASYLASKPPELVAAVLVHETIHLRIASWGIKYRPDLRARIESICTRKQAAFLRRLHSDRAAEWANEIEAGLESPWWTTEQRRERVREQFEREGIPGWLARFVPWR